MKKLLLFSAGILATILTFAQWEPDVRLTNNGAVSKAAFANTWGIASQGDTLHVVWFDHRDGNYEIYYKMSPDQGNTWGQDTRLTSYAGNSWLPGIAVSGQVLHVAWEDDRNGAEEIYYKRSPDGGLTWEADVRITYANYNAFLVSVAANGSYVHLTWQDERDGNDEVYYKRSADGGATWGADVRLSNDPDYSGLPSVAVFGSIVHIAWEEYRNGNGEIYYIRSGDYGANWGPETRLTNTVLETWNPSIAVSGSTVHCTYMEDVMGGDYEIFYIRSTNSGLTWDTPVRLSNNIAVSIYPNIASLGQDVHVAWKDQRDGQPEIYYQKSSDGGTTWSLIEMRLTNAAGISENPTICATPAATHVVWHDNRYGNYEIFYKRNFNTLPEIEYYERLFHLCKAWGHAKYRHTEIAAGDLNWDEELFTAIHGAKFEFSNQGFNDSLQLILDHAGPMGISQDTLPWIPDSLNNVIDYSWIQDTIFSDSVRTLLDTIRSRFRPQQNVYLLQNPAGNPAFENDQLFYSEPGLPSEEIRLLALFRYWNIINYLFPYKDLMDQDWDTTLTEFIPKFVSVNDSISYSLCIKELTTRINDSHAYLSSPSYQAWRGSYYPPFLVRYIENEMVVTKVLSGVSDISVGDIVKAIDGEDIYALRDSLRIYAHGSNEVNIEKELNGIIMWGPAGTSQVVLDDGNNLDTLSIVRNGTNYTSLNTDEPPIWYDTLVNGICRFGVVNMRSLTTSQVGMMFNDLWDTDAIIFDIRGYPQGTLWSIVNYIYPAPIHIAKFTVPDIDYPGTLFWVQATIGSGTANPYAGNIMMLFDERTMSQAEYTCMGLEQFPGALKIGSTTAAADGNVSKIYLPGNTYTYMTGLGTFYPDYTQTQRIGIIPDHDVQPTIAGIRAGIDEVLAFALDCTLIGINQPSAEQHFLLYPNPSRDKIFYQLPDEITGRKVQIELFDLYGRRVMKLSSQNSCGEISLAGIAPGAYVLVVNTGNQVITRKIIKH